MGLYKVILLLGILVVLLLQMQTGIASGSIFVADADAVRNFTLNTAPNDALDSTDASEQETFIDVYVCDADAARDFNLSSASEDALDSTDAPEQETFIDVYVCDADAMRDFDLSTAPSDALDSTDAPEQETFIDVFVSDADAIRDFNLEPAEPITPEHNAPNPPTNLAQFKSDGVTGIPVGGMTDERTVIFKGNVSDPDGDKVKIQIELRRLDEYGGQFDETKGGLKDSVLVESGSEAVAYAWGLINADYHWRARAVDEHGEPSEWVDFGGNDISDADFTVKVSSPLTADSGGPYHGNVNEPIQFNGSAMGGTPPYTYEWTFDTGKRVIDQNATYTWSTVGEHSAILTVFDSAGLTSSRVCWVQLYEPFTFVQVTDVHIGWDQKSGIHYKKDMKQSVERFADALKAVNDSNPKPAFILNTGDLVEWNNPNFFKAFNGILESNDIPTYFIPGNHDRRKWDIIQDDNLENYHKYISLPENVEYSWDIDNYVFRNGEYLFIGLDSGKDYNCFAGMKLVDWTPESDGLKDYQLDFLDAVSIKFGRRTPKIVFMHHPAINDENDEDGDPPVPPNGPGGNDHCITNNRWNFINYTKENNVQLVLTGHTHADKIFDADGYTVFGKNIKKRPLFIQTPSATKDTKGKWFGPVSVDVVIFKHGYRCIKVKDTGAFPYLSTATGAIHKIVGSVTGPINLHAYDSQGRHTGVTDFGDTEQNIPESYYTGNYGDTISMSMPQMIILYNTDDNYRFIITPHSTLSTFTTEQKKLQTTALENESFNLTITNQTADSLTTISYYNISITENTTATLNINKTKTNYTMEIDYTSDNITDETKDPDSIETNYAPTATIISPENNSIFVHEEELTFNGTGTDPEDGVLTNSSLVWTSDIDGIIGVGNEFNTSYLSAGTHKITFIVNDSAGLIGIDSVEITLIAPDLTLNSPDIRFSNPYPIEGESIMINATVHNVGTANSTNVAVQFFDGNPMNCTQIGANQTIAAINAGENKTMSVVWNTTEEAGDNRIWVVVDPSDSVEESDEGNNQANKSIVVGALNLLHILPAQTDRAVYLGNEEVLIACIVQNASGNISANVSADIEKPDGIMDNITLIEGIAGNYKGTFTNTSLSGTYNITIYANRTGFIEDNESLSFEVLDTTPPASIANITHTTGSTWINWTWDNPGDSDFDHTLIYLNGTWKTATSKDYYLAEGLNASTEYEIETRTVDTEGNLNETWVSQTAKTGENQPPIANFTYTPLNPVVNQTITFNASSSYDPDGGCITSYEWHFGDGNTTNTTEETITHSYTSAGTYTVNLTVTDDEGATSTYTQPIFITTIQKGMSYAAWWHDTYTTNDSDASLENLKDTCTEWVSLVVTWYQDNASSTEIYRDDNRTPTDDSLIHAINKIHSLNMSVMLKPAVDLQDADWRGNIYFESEADWTAWFSNYEQFILHYADLAEQNNVEQFCAGVEYKKTVQRESEWRNIFAKVREHYAGPVTYASNWDNYQTINWWDAVDFAGIDAYFPLTDKTNPSVEELKEGWKKWETEIEAWQPTVSRQIIFTELGYCSLNGTNIEPWNWTYSNITDLQEQADCYKAAFQTFWNKPWLAGIYWWMWDTDPDSGGTLDRSYTPYKKPAENIVKKYYCEESMPDLVVTDVWVCSENSENCTICYNVTNIGNGTASVGHNTTLYVDGVEVAYDHVPEELATNESYTGCFNYTWTYTPTEDNITVCADNNETVEESNETNNCMLNIWMCGDVNGDRTVNVVDVLHVYRRALDPEYLLELPWAADVNCDHNINVVDVLHVYRRALDQGYDLSCCCEV